MALPIGTTPLYNLTIPSSGKQVKYRPFLVKEEKALLIAQQSEDAKVMIDTLKDVIRGCIKGDIDTESLATFDLEYIFAQIRAKSVGENVELIFMCDTCNDPNAKVKLTFDLTKLQVSKDPEHTNNIVLYDGTGIIMKYPGIDTINRIQSMDPNNIEQLFGVVVDCIESIYSGEEVYYAREQSKEELKEFIENLTTEQFARVQRFFETMPKIRQDVEFDCPVCGAHHKRYLEGINSFF